MALQLVCPACTIMSDELKTCDICGKQFKHLGKHRRFHNPELVAEHKAKTSVGTRKAQESPEYHERLSRYQTQMKNEVEVMEGRGFSRFYDCGNKVKSFI